MTTERREDEIFRVGDMVKWDWRPKRGEDKRHHGRVVATLEPHEHPFNVVRQIVRKRRVGREREMLKLKPINKASCLVLKPVKNPDDSRALPWLYRVPEEILRKVG